LKIIVFILAYLSISIAAYADQPLDGIKVLKTRQSAVTIIKTADKSKPFKPSRVNIRPKHPKSTRVNIRSKSPKLSPVNIEPETPKPLLVNIQEDDFKNGMQNYRERKYMEAIGSLSKHASVAPKSQQWTAALLIIGKSLEEMNRPRSALNIYNRVTETVPNSPEALLGIVAMADIGVAHPDLNYNSGKKGAEYFRDPVTAYDTVLSKNVPPQIIEHIHYQRGLALWKTKRYEEARDALMVLLKKFPQTAYREEGIGIIGTCTALLIDKYYQSGDHIAVVDLFLQDWKEGFIRPDDADTLLKSFFSLSCLGLHEMSSNILNTLKKTAPRAIPSYFKKLDKMVAEMECNRTPASSDQTPVDLKWRQFQSGREYFATNQSALAEETLTGLKNGNGDPFWPKIAEYAVEEYRWVQKYQEQIRQ
jgi:TolA-binding protein